MLRKTMLRRLELGDDPLELSIKKWKDIVKILKFGSEKRKEKFIKLSSRINESLTCALCEKFYDSNNINTCSQCPVYKKTGMDGCHGTPWVSYNLSTNLENAQRVLDFAISLREDRKKEVVS